MNIVAKASFTLRDETMRYQTHDSLTTFNNGLGLLKTKSGGGSREGVGWEDVLGRDFVLSDLIYF